MDMQGVQDHMGPVAVEEAVQEDLQRDSLADLVAMVETEPYLYIINYENIR
jgi:hypothetical protein